MPWIRIACTILAGGILSSLTDWLFMGDWLYKRYDTHPEIWRYPGGQGETRAILQASLLPFLTCAVFTLLCVGLHRTTCAATLQLALAIWLIAPLPLILTNAIFMKMAPLIATSYALGWLVKLIIAALAVALILH